MTTDHSGFQTKQQETFYNKTVERLVFLLAQRLLVFYKPEESFNILEESKWVKQLRKCCKAMEYMEKGKSSSPRLSEIQPLRDVSNYLKSIFETESNSTISGGSYLDQIATSDFLTGVRIPKNNRSDMIQWGNSAIKDNDFSPIKEMGVKKKKAKLDDEDLIKLHQDRRSESGDYTTRYFKSNLQKGSRLPLKSTRLQPSPQPEIVKRQQYEMRKFASAPKSKQQILNAFQMSQTPNGLEKKSQAILLQNLNSDLPMIRHSRQVSQLPKIITNKQTAQILPKKKTRQHSSTKRSLSVNLLQQENSSQNAHSIRQSSARSKNSFKATHREIIQAKPIKQQSRYLRNVMPIVTSQQPNGDYDELQDFLQNTDNQTDLVIKDHPNTSHLLKRRKIKKRQDQLLISSKDLKDKLL